MLRILPLAAALSLLVSTASPAAQTKSRPAAEKLTFGAYEVLDVATVDRTTFTPRSVMLVRTEKPDRILLLSSNQSEAQLLQGLQALTVEGCRGGVAVLSREDALMMSKGPPVAADLLLRSARSRKPPAIHDAQFVAQGLVMSRFFILQPHFPSYRCELPLPPPR